MKTDGTKTHAELISDEFLEQTLTEIRQIMPATRPSDGGMDRFTRQAMFRRELRKRILERLER